MGRMPLLLLGLVAVVLLLAAPDRLRAQDTIDCGYPLNAEERAACAQMALSEANTAMQQALDATLAVMADLDQALPEDLRGSPQALQAAQDAWTTYRRKDCEAYAFPFRAEVRGDTLFLSCMIITTLQRTEDLNAMVEDYGTD